MLCVVEYLDMLDLNNAEFEDFSSLLDSYLDERADDILVLGRPLTLGDFRRYSSCDFSDDSVMSSMHSEERAFAECMVKDGLIVYREPQIRDCNCIPDFYVYNPESEKGTVVEITMYEKATLSKRKRKQISTLTEYCDFYDLRFIVLYRESIRKVLKGLEKSRIF